MERDGQIFLSFFTKMEKTPGDIIILHKCIKNHDHMLDSFWDIMYIGCFFFSNLDYFLPFYTPKPPLPPPAPANDPKNQKFLKIWKKTLEISSFDTCVPKIMITWCTVPEIWFGRIAGQTDGQTDGKSDI